MSSDGTRLALAGDTGQTYTSVDSGTTWLSNSVPNVTPHRIACSGDGSILVMAATYGIYSSTDWGATWITNSAPNDTSFSKIACSTDGTKMIAATDQIYVSPPTVLPGNVGAWGSVIGPGANVSYKAIPPGIGPVKAIAATGFASFVVKPDGTVFGWGLADYGLTNVPASLSNVVSVAVGKTMCLALKADGTVASWGAGTYTYSNSPTLTDIMAVAASTSDTFAALRSNGTVVVWGNSISVPASATNLVAIALGDTFFLGLRADGTTVGYINTSNVVSIAAWADRGAYVKADGTMVIFPTGASYTSPPALTNVLTVCMCDLNFLALTSDGSVWEWGLGYKADALMSYHVGLPYARAIAAGTYHALAIAGDASPFIINQPHSQTVRPGTDLFFNVGATGAQPTTYQWQCNGTNIDGATTQNLFLTNIPASAAGTYSCTVANGHGAPATTSATLTVLRSTPQFDGSAASWSSDTGFDLALHGLSGHGDLVIYASPDLILWDPIYTNPPTVGSLQWLDPNATNFPNRFYRAEER